MSHQASLAPPIVTGYRQKLPLGGLQIRKTDTCRKRETDLVVRSRRVPLNGKPQAQNSAL